MASIRRMQHGSWQAIVRRKGYRPQFHTFESRQDAQQWARKLEGEIDRAVFVDRGPSERITLGELIDRYCAEIVPAKKSARSLTVTLRYMRLHGATSTLATLQAKDVAAYRDQRIAPQIYQPDIQFKVRHQHTPASCFAIDNAMNSSY